MASVQVTAIVPAGVTMMARVEAPHFVAGIVLSGTTVTEAAPIVRYMVGWDARAVATYVRHKGWAIARVPRAWTPDAGMVAT